MTNVPLISHREISCRVRFRQHPTMSACWIWVGRTRGGIPRTPYGASARQDVYERVRGERPGGVLKPRCGRQLCVNPSHLSPGNRV